MKKGIIALCVLLAGGGVVYGVNHFRENRLMPSQVKAMATAENRLAQASAAIRNAETFESDLVLAKAEELENNKPFKTALQVALHKSEEAREKSLQMAGAATPPTNTADKNPAVAMPAKSPQAFRVAFETNKGEFIVDVVREWAPNGVDRFFELLQTPKFYDQMKFFRVVKDPTPFVVQFGIPADPGISGDWVDNNIPDDPRKKSNLEGYLTFAAAKSANSRSTQMFINLGENTYLDTMGFAPFGKVVSGMDVIMSFNGNYSDTITSLQGQIVAQGNAFLDAMFPGLDYIIRVRYLGEIPVEEAAKDLPKPSTDAAPAGTDDPAAPTAPAETKQN
ncbi:MAG: hypothetical protein AMXMBFR84_41360 [Candidatus Hydrogenedentota bacterium]